MSMMTTIQKPAISRAIKCVGIGKKGSKDLDPILVEEVLNELKTGKVSLVAKGAFFAGLILKGPNSDEAILEQHFPPGTFKNLALLVEALTPEAPEFIKQICVNLLKGRELDYPTAKCLGRFLMSQELGDGARGMIACALRVRYETLDEYTGLLESIEETLQEPFTNPKPQGEPVIQLAEPFDGVDHSYLITPLLAEFLQKFSFRVISLVGRNSGPKTGNNLFGLVKTLGIPFTKDNQELKNPKPKFGWYFDQADLSKALDRWVDLRKKIIKRPFLATLEKFINPTKADILVTSAFHPPYGKKMLNIAERVGFKSAIVIRNGLEGTIAFPLKRPVKILCTTKNTNNHYIRHELTFDAQEYFKTNIDVEEKMESPSLEENAKLIKEYSLFEKTNNSLFNLRVKATQTGLQQALDWINKNSSP